MSFALSTSLRRGLVLAALAAFGIALAGCGVNNVPTLEEKAKAAWSEVQNQYQRRADLIPNLVETVKGYATQEREVLTQVIEARAKATQVKVDASTITDPAKISEIEQRAQALQQQQAAEAAQPAVQEEHHHGKKAAHHKAAAKKAGKKAAKAADAASQ